MLALYLRRIRLTRSVLALKALADEIEQQYPTDEATPRLLDVIAVKVARLATSNYPSAYAACAAVSSATRAERRFAAVAREAASCVSNASTKAISCSTLATIRRCSARGSSRGSFRGGVTTRPS